MTRLTIVDGGFERFEFTSIGTETYAKWLREDLNTRENGFPPHIGFGGCIVSNPVGDPTFHSRWVEKTKRELREGLLPAA